jgi:uncharacterized protein (TIGR03435 family)
MKEAKPGDVRPVVKGFDGKPTNEDALFTRPGIIRGQQVPMSSLALALTSANIGRQVVDRTGLSGRYDFDLEWNAARDTATTPPMSNDPLSSGAPADSSGISVFTAIQATTWVEVGARQRICGSTRGRCAGAAIGELV